jgi:hypothetical protein
MLLLPGHANGHDRGRQISNEPRVESDIENPTISGLILVLATRSWTGSPTTFYLGHDP